MSVVYLIRHGQAGTRENYDSLSELGAEQARLAGEWFAGEGVVLNALVCGSLNRQQATATLARAAAESAGCAMPEIEVDAGWDEFDLAQVYAGIGPQIARGDARFAREWEQMQMAVAASRNNHQADVHRRWNDCDRRVVQAWVRHEFDFDGESFAAFQERIRAAFRRTLTRHPQGNIAVFTSATPIGVCCGETFEVRDGRALQFAAVLHNAAITTIRRRAWLEGDELRLFTFNTVAHLPEPRLRTFR